MQEHLELLPPAPREGLWSIPPGCEYAEFTRHVIPDFNPLSGNFKKDREIWAPNPSMAKIHERFLKRLRELKIEMPYATGGRPRHSPATNVERHADNRYFYLLDLTSAYSQVDPAQLATILQEFDPNHSDTYLIENWLKRYCIHPNGKGLLTGAPSSPELFNIYLLPLDDKLGELAAKFGLVYTRYLDDLTFSSADTGDTTRDRIGKHKRRQIREIIQEAGLAISDPKTKTADLQRGPVVITGLQLNRSGKWQLPTAYQRAAKKKLDELKAQVDGGWPLNGAQRAILSGMNGLIRSTIDRRRVIYRPQEHTLLKLYESIRRRDKELRKRYPNRAAMTN